MRLKLAEVHRNGNYSCGCEELARWESNGMNDRTYHDAFARCFSIELYKSYSGEFYVVVGSLNLHAFICSFYRNGVGDDPQIRMHLNNYDLSRNDRITDITKRCIGNACNYSVCYTMYSTQFMKLAKLAATLYYTHASFDPGLMSKIQASRRNPP